MLIQGVGFDDVPVRLSGRQEGNQPEAENRLWIRDKDIFAPKSCQSLIHFNPTEHISSSELSPTAWFVTKNHLEQPRREAS